MVFQLKCPKLFYNVLDVYQKPNDISSIVFVSFHQFGMKTTFDDN